MGERPSQAGHGFAIASIIMSDAIITAKTSKIIISPMTRGSSCDEKTVIAALQTAMNAIIQIIIRA